MIEMHERPGVYLEEESSGLFYRASGQAVGIVAPAQKGGGNRMYTVTRPSDAETLFGESDLALLCAMALYNGAARVLAVPAGADYGAAFALLEREPICVLVCGSAAESDGRKLVESVEKSAGMGRERLGALACAGEAADVWAKKFSSNRLLLTAQAPLGKEGMSLPGAALAAALAGRVARLQSADESLTGAALTGIDGLAHNPSEEEIDAFVRAGITPLEAADGQVFIVRAVVTDPESGFDELFTRLAADRTIAAVREALKALLPGMKNTAVSRSILAAQAAAVLEQKRREGWLEGFEPPKAAAHETDPALCVVRVAFTVAQGLNRVLLSVRIVI